MWTSGGAQRLDHRQPVHAGQHAVQDHGVEVGGAGEVEAVAAVGGVLDRRSLPGEGRSGGFRRRPAVVLDDEDLRAHRRLCPSSAELSGARERVEKAARRPDGGRVAPAATPWPAAQTQTAEPRGRASTGVAAAIRPCRRRPGRPCASGCGSSRPSTAWRSRTLLARGGRGGLRRPARPGRGHGGRAADEREDHGRGEEDLAHGWGGLLGRPSVAAARIDVTRPARGCLTAASQICKVRT